MKLQIKKTTKIQDLQDQFSFHYPYLKIEFYKKPHGESELSALKDRISPRTVVSKISELKGPATIDISNQRIVADLEAEVYHKLGVAVQVSRRTGNIWIETSLTDNRTLGMQNEQGKMSASANEEILFKQVFGS